MAFFLGTLGAAFFQRAVARQSLLFQKLRWRLLGNSLAGLRQGPWVRFATILFASALVWLGVFAVSAEGFHFLRNSRVPIQGGIIGALFDLLFLTLMMLLIFSTAIILYTGLFSTPEIAFLLSSPAAADQVFAYKYQEAVAFSSWGFILLASPILVAYGLACAAPWYFFPLLLLFFVGFVLLPGSLGALACILIVNFLPRRPRQVLALAVLIVLVTSAGWIYSVLPEGWEGPWNAPVGRDFVERLLGEDALTRLPLAPNHWMTRGLQSAARGNIATSSYYLALVWSNGLVLYMVAAGTARALYRRGYNRVATGGMLRKRYGGHWLDQALNFLVRFLDPQTRLLIVKDFRTFRRDPAQWAQVLIFMGLFILYFANVRRFYQEQLGRDYQNGISLINLAATALLLCAYTGRFIFPMLSLEGRKFWILGLLPFRRERLLWGKFAFSATWALLTAEFLVIFSDLMLAMPWSVIGVHILTVAVLAVGLSGLSVGMGAWMPNFRESDPSKIAVGFGGTLNLVAGLFFMIVVISLMAAPIHIRLAVTKTTELSTGYLIVTCLGLAAGMAVGAAAVVIPLRIGAANIRRMEF